MKMIEEVKTSMFENIKKEMIGYEFMDINNIIHLFENFIDTKKVSIKKVYDFEIRYLPEGHLEFLKCLDLEFEGEGYHTQLIIEEDELYIDGDTFNGFVIVDVNNFKYS